MKYFVVTGLLFFVSLTYVGAQQPVADTVNLKVFEVTGKAPSVVSRAASPVQRMEAGVLKELPGASAAEALRHFSGVTIKEYGGLCGLKTMMVRSMGANHTGIFVDGVPLSDAASGQIDLGKIPLENLETIELSVGQVSSLCQSARAQASASVVGFFSPATDFSDTKLQLRAGFKTGSFGVINPFANAGFKLSTRTMAGVTADYNHTRGDYPFVLKNGNLPDTTLRRTNAEMESLNLVFKTETRYSDSSKLKVRLSYYGSKRGLPGAVIYYNPYSVQRLNNSDFYGNVQYQVQRRKVRLLTHLNFSDSRLHYRDPAYLNNSGGLDNQYNQQEYYASQALSWSPGRILSMGAAGDIVVNGLQTDLYQTGNPLRYSGMGSLSIRAKTRRTEATAILLATAVNESAPGKDKNWNTAVTPSLSVVTRLSSAPLIRLRTMYKSSFRMPTFHDLYYNHIGNVNLKPEYVHQLNAGLIFSGETAHITLDVMADIFLNRVKDKIVAVPTQNLFVWSMRNLGKADTKGLDLQAGIKYRLYHEGAVSLNPNYTHQQALDMSTPGSATYRQQIPYIPFQTFSGMLSMGFRKLSFTCNMLYNSHRYTQGENIAANFLPSWWVTDVSASWQQPYKSHFIILQAEVINLLNTQYEVIKGFPMNGRGFYITFSYKY